MRAMLDEATACKIRHTDIANTGKIGQAEQAVLAETRNGARTDSRMMALIWQAGKH